MSWSPTILSACAATMLGSMAMACPNNNGGKVFDGNSVDLCFPSPVQVMPRFIGQNESTFFSGKESANGTDIFGWLTTRSGENDDEISAAELVALARLFAVDESAQTVSDLGDDFPTMEAVALIQVGWPVVGLHHGVNCAIYLKDSHRLVYCGAVFATQPLSGSYDLFNQFAMAVEFL